MGHEEVRDASTTEGLPVAPSMGPGLASVHAPRESTVIDARTVGLSFACALLGLVAVGVAEVLMKLIALITHLSFFGNVSTEGVSPADNHLGPWVLAIPVVGALVVGVMARYGSAAIRGHGIPEAMEQILQNESRIPPKMTFLKPLSAAISIGTGGPFGAEGPIIATGGALGSTIGQWVKVTTQERKTLLAAGAAAGMSATFGSPLSAVVLAVELLLFELRPKSIVPVALAASVAAAARWSLEGAHPVFAMPDVIAPSFSAMLLYVAIGAVIGVLSVGVTKAVYGIEDAFEKLPLHWMWWPALGAIAVGVVGYVSPHTLGVGYDNIREILAGHILGTALLLFIVMKFISWSIALGSGTSGGTLAPLFTVGGGAGALLATLATHLVPAAMVDVRIGALVGMAAMFAGASRALLASVIFAFEVTLQPFGLLPLLGGCTAAYLVSALLMRSSIMTEKLERRGTRVPSEYSADFLERVLVRTLAAKKLVTLGADQTVAEIRQWLLDGGPERSHQGFPVVDADGVAVGVVTRRDLQDPTLRLEAKLREVVKRPPLVVYPNQTLREAADHMVEHGVGRLLVVERSAPRKPIGILTRSDLLTAQATRIRHERDRSGQAPQGSPVRAS